ncbi:RagB/SusD family nutrient uptake outer membrane protein [Prevotella sp. KH2C16]|uniref:RagB/SusD family nutrient uptake outer membrane protein n=1 Tax=Prevotella sp. KH2C16 TaxID=1855325 RepID=UPI0008EAD904|nr:RagB/SusD family nutrient uptake outer membrane protein [Prevotella sp. KH2C16]SFF87986.1 SusD family protein [Prevotella sp. KH2C16]
MKHKLYIGILSGLLLFTTGCNDWLDVPVDGQFTKGELSAIGDGYRLDLHGLYKKMASRTLYGFELQFGMVDFFSNQYDINVGTNKLKDPVYIAAGKRDYNNPDLLPLIDKIWLHAYNTIAQANNLINRIQDEPNDKFSNGEMEKNLILGEAKACRAFLHFDLLRLFAPAPADDDNKPHIPYITTFPETRGQHLTVKETIAKIIEDLEEARTLVKPYDDSPLGQSASATGRARFYNDLQPNMEGYTTKENLDEFLLGRGYRFSYWAITALLSRAYQYNATYEQGDLTKAKAYAEEVLNVQFNGANSATFHPFKEESFAFTYQEQPEEMSDIRMVDNLIMGVYNEKEITDVNLDKYFPRSLQQAENNVFIVNLEGQDIFKNTDGSDDSQKDIRRTRLIYEPNSSWATYLSTKWYVKEKDTKERDNTVTILPLLRTSELRYIIAECEARNGNFAAAYEILNTMRAKRGITDNQLAVKSSMADFIKDLVREGQREWISEGQLFYLYKRLQANVKRDDGSSRPFTTAESVLPIPTDENR